MILNLVSTVFSGHISTSTYGYILIGISLCCQVPLLTARSRLDMGEEKIANEIDDYFRFSLASHWYWGWKLFIFYAGTSWYTRGTRGWAPEWLSCSWTIRVRFLSSHFAFKDLKRLLISNDPGQSFFFAFGAGHFVGDQTILDVVRKAGFKVDQVRFSWDQECEELLKLITWQVEATDDLSAWHQGADQPKGFVFLFFLLGVVATNSLAATLSLFQFWILNWTRKPAQTTKRRHGDGDNWRPLRWWEDQGFPPAAWVQAQDGERAGLLLLWNHLLCDWNIFSVRELKMRKRVSIRRIQASMNFGRGFPLTRSTPSGESLSRWQHAKMWRLSENTALCYILHFTVKRTKRRRCESRSKFGTESIQARQ